MRGKLPPPVQIFLRANIIQLYSYVCYCGKTCTIGCHILGQIDRRWTMFLSLVIPKSALIGALSSAQHKLPPVYFAKNKALDGIFICRRIFLAAGDFYLYGENKTEKIANWHILLP